MLNNFEKYKNIESVLMCGEVENKKKPIFSVVIPTYNRKKLLQETLESVLKQNVDVDYEIIIVDNNDDFKNLEVLKIIKSYKNRKIFYYKNKKNIGATGNWNRCIELSTAEWIIMIHDDDIMLNNALNEIKKIKDKYECDLIHFQHITKDFINNKIKNPTNGKQTVEKIKLERFLCGPQILAPVSTAFRKSCAIDIGGFNNDYLPSIDYEFWVRYISKYKGLYIKNNPIAIYRLEDNDSLKKSTIIGVILSDYKILKKLENKYKVQYKLSKYDLLWRIYKKKKLNKEEKKQIMKKLEYTRQDLIIAFLLRKTRVIQFWNIRNKIKTEYLEN